MWLLFSQNCKSVSLGAAVNKATPINIQIILRVTSILKCKENEIVATIFLYKTFCSITGVSLHIVEVRARVLTFCKLQVKMYI